MLERIIEIEQNPNVEIWSNWLLCLLKVSPKTRVDSILKRIKQCSVYENKMYDIVADGCEALLTLPEVNAMGYNAIEELVFSDETDPFDAACVLEDWLRSQYVSSEGKVRVRQKAISSGQVELIRVAEGVP